MTHPWANNVVGGVGTPRAILCSGYDLVVNGSFEENLDGWVAGSGANIFRLANITSPHGNNCLKVSDISALMYGSARHIISLLNNSLTDITNCSGKQFILTFYAKEGDADVGSHNTSCSLYDGQQNNIKTETFQVTTLGWKRVAIVLDCDYGNSSNDIVIELAASENLFDKGSVLYDKIELYVVDNDYSFNVPEGFEQNFEKVMNYHREMWDGSTKSSIKGYRYNAELYYPFLDAAQLQAWIEVSESTFCLFFPHSDHVFATKVEWDGDFPYKYFKGKYLGHEMTARLRGMEILTNKPVQVGSGGVEARVSLGTYIF
jgi:hypothetical protein